MSRRDPTISRLLLGACIVGAIASAAAPRLAAQASGRYDHYEIYDDDLLPTAEYAGRRQSVLARLGPRTAMLVRSADPRNRSNDVDYEFRQRNSFLYLSGVTEQSSALLLVPEGVEIDGRRVTEVLFVSDRNPMTEIWTGLRMGQATAARVTGIATVESMGSLREVLDDLLPDLDTIFYDGWRHGADEEPLTGEIIRWPKEAGKELAERLPRLKVKDARSIVDEMRLVKSPAEIALLKKAVDISMEAHRETIRGARPGMHEYELEAIMEYTFHRLGAEHPGYPSIVGSGPNSCILHYESNRRRTEPGDLVLMDCGAEYHGYSADITRTLPITGTFTPEQRAIYDLVLRAQDSGIAACRVGNEFRDTHIEAFNVLAEGMIELGIIEDAQDLMRYFMHGTSHYLGLDVHDVGSRGKLRAGMVLTVEPGIYIAAGSPCDPKWWNIGIRIEDNIVVTEKGPLNLSAGLERTAEQIEALMKSGRRSSKD